MEYNIHNGDNLEILKKLQDTEKEKYSLIYIDPPFNTGKFQSRKLITVQESASSSLSRKGFGDKSYEVMSQKESPGYNDSFSDYENFLMDRVKASLPLLKKNGSIFIHLDQNEVHYIKVAMDKLIGRKNFINEIIWQSEWGAKSKSKYSKKHDTILWYAMNPKDYIFNYDQIDRIPYLAPALVGPEKAAKGKTITDVWFLTVVGTNSYEKTGYATQKPISLLKRLVKMHTNENDWILDYFGGSGTAGDAALSLNRNATLIDSNIDAINIINKRLQKYNTQDPTVSISPDTVPDCDFAFDKITSEVAESDDFDDS